MLRQKYRNDLTAELVRSLLDYDHLTGNFTWRVDRGSKFYVRVRAGDVAGSINGVGYIDIRIRNTAYKAHRLAWLWVTGEWPKEQIDHINRIRNDNRWVNLREATQSQNNVNSPPRDKLTEFPHGVSRNKRRFRARIGKNNLHLGTFDTVEEASAAYIAAAQEFYGEFYIGGQHMNNEFNNDTDQHTRREVLRNDTLFARQQNTADDAGGRYAKLTPATITGSTSSPQYPKQPANTFWSFDPVPATEPLGFSVNAMEPVGTQAEIEASIPTLKPPEVHAIPATVEDRVGEPVGTPPLVPTGSRSIKRRGFGE